MRPDLDRLTDDDIAAASPCGLCDILIGGDLHDWTHEWGPVHTSCLDAISCGGCGVAHIGLTPDPDQPGTGVRLCPRCLTETAR